MQTRIGKNHKHTLQLVQSITFLKFVYVEIMIELIRMKIVENIVTVFQNDNLSVDAILTLIYLT